MRTLAALPVVKAPVAGCEGYCGKQEEMALYLGLISGTSMDAIDAALLEVNDEAVTLRDSLECPYPAKLRARLERAVRARHAAIDEIGSLHTAIGQTFAATALELIERNALQPTDVAAIGSHGQTIGHGIEGATPYTLQIGDPNVIAWRTGIRTVADFRAKDVAAGGQGAPLVPGFHRQVFRRADCDVAVVNIGGISNVSLVSRNPLAPLLGFDCGPGNTLMDLWAQRHLGTDYDTDGVWARQGTADPVLLAALKSDPYFSLAPPKSTGREYFHEAWLANVLSRLSHAPSAVDVQATLARLTAECVSAAIDAHQPDCRDVVVCGGGARNAALMKLLAECVSPKRAVRTSDEAGWPSGAIEASTFAWLAHRRLAGLAGNEPSVTGASAPVLLGAVYEAR